MTKQSREGKRRWQDRRAGFAQEIIDQVTTEASERMDSWAERGRVPWPVRAKAALRGQRISVPGSDPR